MNHKEEIRKELESLSPYLAGLELRSAFKVPKGYFDELPEMILESVSPLAELNKESAFSVPDNYFESLPDLVMARVTPERATEPVTAPVSQTTSSSNWLDDLINSVAVLFQPRYALRLATVAVVLIGGFIFLKNQTNSTGAIASGDPVENFETSNNEFSDADLAFLLNEESAIPAFEESEDIDALLDELLEDLDEISDADLEGFM